MKVVLAFVCLCGILLSVDATCSTSACRRGTSCSSLTGYQNCLTTEIAGCTSSDTATKTILETAKAGISAIRKILGCGASGLTISGLVLFLSFVASLLKL